MKKTIPVVKGKTYEIEIHGLGSSGEGVGKFEGFTVNHIVISSTVHFLERV